VADPLRLPPIGFAHRGARSVAPENTIDAFTTAVALGATGLESDVWLTADGVPVLDHDGVVRSGLRKRAIADVVRSGLPSHIPSVPELYDAVGSGLELSLDVKDPNAAAATVAAAREAGGDDALGRLWLCSPRWELAASWRRLSDVVRLVDSTRLKHLKEGPERRAATLAANGVDGWNMHHSDWNTGLTTLGHRFGLHCFAWDCQFERILVRMLADGIDGVYCDDVATLTSCLTAWTS
jgi:glycerophosphoryl diester phosphodiesterase